MDSNQKRSVDDAIGETLRNLATDNKDFLSEDGLARAIHQSQKLAGDTNPAAFVELKSGDKIGDFEIESKLAQGGMGIIYSAIQRPLGRRVALKTVIPTNTTRFTLERFRRERTLLGELHESNIVSIFAAGLENGIEYFAMPFISGRSLKEIVSGEKRNQIPVARAVEILTDLADGTEAIHEKGIIHRDITPNNVILDENGRAWLIDFGIATRVSGEDKNEKDLEIYDLSTDGRIGTPRYKAPELEHGIAGKQTDVFGLGVCFYCLLSGNDFSLEAFRRAEPTKPGTFYRGLPKALVAVCDKALNEDPEHRYQTAGEFSEDLRRWQRSEPVSSKAYQAHQRIWLWVKRNPIKTVATAAAFLIMAITSLAVIKQAESQSRTREAELKSHLSRLESTLLAGEFDEAAMLVSTNEDMLQISAKEDPDLFIKLVKMLFRSKGKDEAVQQLRIARAGTDDLGFVARLDLVEADILYALDFEESESLARKALASGKLNKPDVNFANALLATNAIEEQEYLRDAVKHDPFHLRAQQLLVANYLFLGQESRAREQLASGQSLFPSDPSLKLAEAILNRLYSTHDGQLPLISEMQTDDIAVAPDWRQFEDADKIPNKIVDVFPRVKKLADADNNVVVEEIDRFLIALHAVQTEMANTGYVIFPPSLHRALSSFEPVVLPNVHPEYWPRLEIQLEPLARANPDMLFLFAQARSIYSRRNPSSKEWLASEKLLEQALISDSIFPIRPIVIQQLALARVQIYYHASGRSESAKEKMVGALKLLNDAGRMPQLEFGLFDNLVEAAFESGELDLAADFCLKWRQKIEQDNGTKEQKANALGYSAMVAIGRDQYFSALGWSSDAIKLSPRHRYHKAHLSFQKQAAEKLPEIAQLISELLNEQKTTKNND